LSQKFVAFSPTTMLPTGPLSFFSDGMTGITQIIDTHGIPSCLKYLQHSLVVQFVHKCQQAPDIMATTWISRRWICEALPEHSLTPGCVKPGEYDIWRDTERPQAFRLHHNFLATGAKLSWQVLKSYYQYVHRAYDGLYTASTALGALPLALAGDLYYL
jgi:hypothetical protein